LVVVCKEVGFVRLLWTAVSNLRICTDRTKGIRHPRLGDPRLEEGDADALGSRRVWFPRNNGPDSALCGRLVVAQSLLPH